MKPFGAFFGTKCTPYLKARVKACSGVKGLNAKRLNIDCTNNIIFSEFCCSHPLWLRVKLANLKHAEAFTETKISILRVTLVWSSGALMPWSKQNKRVNRVLFCLHSYTYMYVAGRMKWGMLIAHVSFSFSWGGGGWVWGPVFNFLEWTNTSLLKTTKEEGNALPTNG